MKVQNNTTIPNSSSFCKAEKQHEHENKHVHESVEKNKIKVIMYISMQDGRSKIIPRDKTYEASYLEIEVSIFE